MDNETQSSLLAAFPFGGHSLHECNITQRNGTHAIIYIDKEIEKCNLCICNSVEEKQLKEGWKSVIVHNSREEEILEEIKKVVHP